MTGKTLADKLFDDQKVAMKAQEKFRLSVLRMVRAELQNAVIAKQAPLTAEEELEILTREVKKRKESLGDYRKSGRENLVKDLEQEIEILSTYLPEQLSAGELEELVREAINETGAEGMKEMGRVMSFLMPRVKGKADGSLVRQIVEEKLK